MADGVSSNAFGSFVVHTETPFSRYYELMEAFEEKLEVLERNYKDQISTINTNVNAITFDGWNDEISTSLSSYLGDFKKEYFTKIQNDIVGGNFVDLMKRVTELKEALGKCVKTKEDLDTAEDAISKQSPTKTVKNTNKKKATDPDTVEVRNSKYYQLQQDIARLKGDLDDEIKDCNGIASQIKLIEFDKDYEYTPYQFTDTTLDDDQYKTDDVVTTTVEDLGNGQVRKTTTTVMADGTTVVEVAVYYDRDGDGVPDEGMPYTENTYIENIPGGNQQDVADDTLEGTGLDVTVDGDSSGGETEHHWTTYEEAVKEYPAAMTENEWEKYGGEYPTYQAYLDSLYAKVHPESAAAAAASTIPTIALPAGLNIDTAPTLPDASTYGGLVSSNTEKSGDATITMNKYADGTEITIASSPKDGTSMIIYHNDGTSEGYERLSDGTYAYRTYDQSERANWMGTKTGEVVVNPDKSVTVTTYEGGKENVTTYPAGSYTIDSDNTIHIAGVESAMKVSTVDPYDANFGNTSRESTVKVVDGTNGETVGQIKLETTIYGPGGTVEGVQNNGTTTFALGDNGNSGTLTYNHPDSNFECTMSYDESTHTVTETVIDNGRETTRTVPYIAETYEISTPSGTYEVTINPNTEAGKLYLSDFVANLASNQDNGQRAGFDLATEAVWLDSSNTSISDPNIGFTITVKSQEFYRPDGSFGHHDYE